MKLLRSSISYSFKRVLMPSLVDILEKRSKVNRMDEPNQIE